MHTTFQLEIQHFPKINPLAPWSFFHSYNKVNKSKMEQKINSKEPVGLGLGYIQHILNSPNFHLAILASLSLCLYSSPASIAIATATARVL